MDLLAGGVVSEGRGDDQEQGHEQQRDRYVLLHGARDSGAGSRQPDATSFISPDRRPKLFAARMPDRGMRHGQTGDLGAVHKDDVLQKKAYGQYLEAAIELDGPELAEIAQACGDLGIFAYVGTTERGVSNARGTIFCTLVAIDPRRGIVGAHRKLMPTYDERLVWGGGDGYGLRVHDCSGVRVGGLNCWENWMPQARHALYADGEDLHVGVWPGSAKLTGDITRFVALEGRVYSMAASGVMLIEDIPPGFAFYDLLRELGDPLPFNGGSCIADPLGRWVVEPVTGREALVTADIDLTLVREERLTLDTAGHYGRPDVFETTVHRRRLQAANFRED